MRFGKCNITLKIPYLASIIDLTKFSKKTKLSQVYNRYWIYKCLILKTPFAQALVIHRHI